ncbi:MAG: hypothetical protein Q4G04_00765 [bacterium]|nr:hypothetical protein [bacterium]
MLRNVSLSSTNLVRREFFQILPLFDICFKTSDLGIAFKYIHEERQVLIEAGNLSTNSQKENNYCALYFNIQKNDAKWLIKQLLELASDLVYEHYEKQDGTMILDVKDENSNLSLVAATKNFLLFDECMEMVNSRINKLTKVKRI